MFLIKFAVPYDLKLENSGLNDSLYTELYHPATTVIIPVLERKNKHREFVSEAFTVHLNSYRWQMIFQC